MEKIYFFWIDNQILNQSLIKILNIIAEQVDLNLKVGDLHPSCVGPHQTSRHFTYPFRHLNIKGVLLSHLT